MVNSNNSLEKEPLVSVIIPTFNCEDYIEEAIDSVLNQTYRKIEIIVVNDGSTDDTQEVLKKYGHKIILINQTNAGAPFARNRGLEIARGKYITFLDSDDIWQKSKIEKQVYYLERNKNVGLVYCDWDMLIKDNTGKFIHQDQSPAHSYVKYNTSGWIYNQLLFDSTLNTSCVMIRDSIIKKVGKFNTKYLSGQDYDYWFRISRLTQVYKLDEKLASYRQHENNMTQKYRDIDYRTLIIESSIQKWGLVGPDGKKTKKVDLYRRLSELSWEYTYNQFWYGNFKIALKSILKSIKYYPFRSRSWIYGIFIVLRILYINLL